MIIPCKSTISNDCFVIGKSILIASQKYEIYYEHLGVIIVDVVYPCRGLTLEREQIFAVHHSVLRISPKWYHVSLETRLMMIHKVHPTILSSTRK